MDAEHASLQTLCGCNDYKPVINCRQQLGYCCPALTLLARGSALINLLARLLFEMLPQQLQRVGVAHQALASDGGKAR